MSHDRRLGPSPFPGDTGEANAETRARLLEAAAEPGVDGYLGAVAALCGDRVLVPVVAEVTQLGTTSGGLTAEKEADMSVVMLRRPDGDLAALAFTGLDALQAWRPDARPVPVTLDVAAQSARSEGAGYLLIDLAGPASLVIEGEILEHLAGGQRLVRTGDGGFGWAVAVGG